MDWREKYKDKMTTAAEVNRSPSSRQLKKIKTFCHQIHSGGSFYATARYWLCFSIGVNTPKFRCNRR